MKNQWIYFVVLLSIPAIAGCQSAKDSVNNKETKMDSIDNYPVKKTDEDWKKELNAEEYRVLREKGTERPFSSEYETLWDSGTYVCKACGAELFKSNTKFDAHCGWPSFYQSIDKSAVKEIEDRSHGMTRTEVVCAKCGGHLGHVFNDGYDQPTGLRYCINGVSLGFKKKE
ncbi:MAG: peptide-methionine (R)-S-oxide reductase MsrB [Bacteroidetes bacterium]|nr:peptide-methionine (R)-S-oxide reductase MsrB [Bacteroidota bacterium]